MRAIIDLPNEQAAQLQASCARQGISRAEAVRRAVNLYIAGQSFAQGTPGFAPAFGLWRNKRPGKAPMDGVTYQRKLRAEWD